MFEFRLPRYRIVNTQRQRIDAGTSHLLAAPVHRDEACPTRISSEACTQYQFATAAPHAHDITRLQPANTQSASVQGQTTALRHGYKGGRPGTGAAHTMPLVAQAAGIEQIQVTRIGRLGNRNINNIGKPGTATGGGKHTVGVQAFAARWRPRPKRPLLRPLAIEQGIAEAGDIEIAASGGRLCSSNTSSTAR